MAKTKKSSGKTVSRKSPKYAKLATQCSKDLEAKKKALIRAEKTLATAKKNHENLLAEVARLDMLDRSLKALINGTEPPQNIKYVYNYPQWVWYPVQPTPWIYIFQYNGSHYVPNGGGTLLAGSQTRPVTAGPF